MERNEILSSNAARKHNTEKLANSVQHNSSTERYSKEPQEDKHQNELVELVKPMLEDKEDDIELEDADKKDNHSKQNNNTSIKEKRTEWDMFADQDVDSNFDVSQRSAKWPVNIRCYLNFKYFLIHYSFSLLFQCSLFIIRQLLFFIRY